MKVIFHTYLSAALSLSQTSGVWTCQLRRPASPASDVGSGRQADHPLAAALLHGETARCQGRQQQHWQSSVTTHQAVHSSLFLYLHSTFVHLRQLEEFPGKGQNKKWRPQ